MNYIVIHHNIKEAGSALLFTGGSLPEKIFLGMARNLGGRPRPYKVP